MAPTSSAVGTSPVARKPAALWEPSQNGLLPEGVTVGGLRHTWESRLKRIGLQSDDRGDLMGAFGRGAARARAETTEATEASTAPGRS